MNTEIYAGIYVPRGYRPLTAEEAQTRRIAKELKIPTPEAIRMAAPAMASLIDGPCWLIPVPASNISVTANLALARAICESVPGSHVKCAITRKHSVSSSRERQLDGLPRLTIEEHAIVRIAGPIRAMPAYFVDNVITTGATITACRRALGWGTGLAFASVSRLYRSNARSSADYSLSVHESSTAYAPLTIRVARLLP